ncbi:hypothetical protein V1T75_06610 [Tenacibaculum sp. FZY0031]|uniref:hypothetical protein n=1 Tax=Tenacibaculum sp. FZY0031 TaxID=3116648 RepID=UPI002E9AD496|nr:hypothetical protein [Tenacibaculum sp. FZY0031]
MDKILRIREEDLNLFSMDGGGSPILYYQGKPFTGFCLTYEEEGWLSGEEEYVNGYQEGWVRDYYKNGQLESEYKMSNNKLVPNTSRDFNEDGTLK